MIFSEGRNNNYLVQGIFLTLGVIIVSFLTGGLLAPLVFIPIGLFIATNGLEVDTRKGRYRVYGSFYGWRFGRWYSFSQPTGLRIALSTENFNFVGYAGTGGYLPQMSGKSLTYNVFLETEQGEYLLFESLSYKFAQSIAQGLGQKMKVPITDSIAEKLRKRYMTKTVHN